MLKQLFLDFQKDISNEYYFNELAKALKVKILSIFKSIECDPVHREDFIQDCHIKILEIARDKKFNDDAVNDRIINCYFERAFLAVKYQFIKEHDLYRNNISLDAEDENGIKLLDIIIDSNQLLETDYSDIGMNLIKKILSPSDYEFLMLFIDNEKDRIRRITEIAKILNVSHQAVSKRFARIKKIAREFID